MVIGIVSDTHALLRPEVLERLAGVEHILHLGDVGAASVLEELGRIAPVTAVRGNTDREGPCGELPEFEVALLDHQYFYMLHNLQQLHLDPAAAKFACVLSGHTHQPEFHRHRGVLYLNPGSCGPRRSNLPISMAKLTIGKDGLLEPELITLSVN